MILIYGTDIAYNKVQRGNILMSSNFFQQKKQGGSR
jgi:hypothetical protein